jgi:pyridoxamine 5'-phosphate oxidase
MGSGMARGLSQETAGNDPIQLYCEWLEDAKRAGTFLHDAITLATCTKDGVPSARMMLLKGLDDRGIVFYTNFDSRKALELEENPRAALISHWPVLERQVRVEGEVERMTTEESSAYFRSRPRGSQLGAWASQQSAPLESPEELKRRFNELDKKYAKGDVPLPPFWGGYRLKPSRIEFWQGRINRLHDRVRFDRVSDGWEVSRLYP